MQDGNAWLMGLCVHHMTIWLERFVMQQVEVALWDTAGQERFHSLAPLYYRDADAGLLVCASFGRTLDCYSETANLPSIKLSL